MNILEFLGFGPEKTAIDLLGPPAKGQFWHLKEDTDPWGGKLHDVEVLDAKEGWVRYYMGPLPRDKRVHVAGDVLSKIDFEDTIPMC